MTYTVKTRGFERSALVMRGRETVAEVFTDREAADQRRTAALFAAAPDLLAALRGIVICADIRESAETQDAYDTRRAMLPQQIARARAAIAKAEGK